jgi:glycosyltransferase involved in cell wall biosynthesis
MHRKLKVAHLSDMPSGGAAVAANRLVHALGRAEGVEIERWIFGKSKGAGQPNPQIALEKDCPKTFPERIIRIFSQTAAKSLQRRRQREALLAAIAVRKPDILHLHNLHACALRHDDLELIPPDVRLVWTMHDCWPFALWAYRWKNENGANEIQGAERRPEAKAASARRSFFARRQDTILVSPSRWLALQAESMDGSSARIEVIPNGVPTDIFAPTPKPQAKAALGLDPSRIWLGLSAASFDHRKGADILMDALKILRRTDLGIVLWGSRQDKRAPDSVEVFSAGYVQDEHRQALLYSACDLFVCPSRIDNLPNTVLESMACKTPVLASNVGGIPEMVHPRQTGWLYAPNTPEACADAVKRAWQARGDWAVYGERCRDAVKAEFSLGRQAASYSGLYLEVSGLDQRSSNIRL